MPARLPRWVRQQLDQAPKNPQTGMVQIALPLGFLEPQWTRGPARDWFGRYRPDLLTRLGALSHTAR